MNSISHISNLFPKHLFWDVNIERLCINADKDLIIPRFLFATTEETFLEDITHLEKLYQPIEIVKELRETKELISNDVCKMVAQRYNLPLFARYKL